jgi:hypothetical protein
MHEVNAQGMQQMHGPYNLDYAHRKGGDPGAGSVRVVSNGVPRVVACIRVCLRISRGTCQARSMGGACVPEGSSVRACRGEACST